MAILVGATRSREERDLRGGERKRSTAKRAHPRSTVVVGTRAAGNKERAKCLICGTFGSAGDSAGAVEALRAEARVEGRAWASFLFT